MDTPYGKPSGPIVTGQIGGVDCVLVARHGPKHRITPTNVPFRANIYALKVSSCSACLLLPACLLLYAASNYISVLLDLCSW